MAFRMLFVIQLLPALLSSVQIVKPIPVISLSENETTLINLSPLFEGEYLDYEMHGCDDSDCSVVSNTVVWKQEDMPLNRTGFRFGPHFETRLGVGFVLFSCQTLELWLIDGDQMMKIRTISTEEDIEGADLLYQNNEIYIVYWTRASLSQTIRLFYVCTQRFDLSPVEFSDLSNYPIARNGCGVCNDQFVFISPSLCVFRKMIFNIAFGTVLPFVEESNCLQGGEVIKMICQIPRILVLTPQGLYQKTSEFELLQFARFFGEPLSLKKSSALMAHVLIFEDSFIAFGEAQHYIRHAVAFLDVTKNGESAIILTEQRNQLYLAVRNFHGIASVRGFAQLPGNIRSGEISDSLWIPFDSSVGANQLLIITGSRLHSFAATIGEMQMRITGAAQSFNFSVCAFERFTSESRACIGGMIEAAPDSQIMLRNGMRLRPLNNTVVISSIADYRHNKQKLDLINVFSGPNLRFSLSKFTLANISDPYFSLISTDTIPMHSSLSMKTCFDNGLIAFLRNNSVTIIRLLSVNKKEYYILSRAINFQLCLFVDSELFIFGEVQQREGYIYKISFGDIIRTSIGLIRDFITMKALDSWISVVSKAKIYIKQIYCDLWETLKLTVNTDVLDIWLEEESVLVLHRGKIEVYSRLIWRYFFRGIVNVTASVEQIAICEQSVVTYETGNEFHAYELTPSLELIHIKKIDVKPECQFTRFERLSVTIAIICKDFVQILSLDFPHEHTLKSILATKNSQSVQASPIMRTSIEELTCSEQICRLNHWRFNGMSLPVLTVELPTTPNLAEISISGKIIIDFNEIDSVSVELKWIFSNAGVWITTNPEWSNTSLSVAWEDSIEISAFELFQGFDMRLFLSEEYESITVIPPYRVTHELMHKSQGKVLICVSPDLQLVINNWVDTLSIHHYVCENGQCKTDFIYRVAIADINFSFISDAYLLFHHGPKLVLRLLSSYKEFEECILVYDTDQKHSEVLHRRKGFARNLNFHVVKISAELVYVLYYGNYLELFTFSMRNDHITVDQRDVLDVFLTNIIAVGNYPNASGRIVYVLDAHFRLFEFYFSSNVTIGEVHSLNVNIDGFVLINCFIFDRFLIVFSPSMIEIMSLPLAIPVRRIEFSESFFSDFSTSQYRIEQFGHIFAVIYKEKRAIIIDITAPTKCEIVSLLPFQRFGLSGERSGYILNKDRIQLIEFTPPGLIIHSKDRWSEEEFVIRVRANNSRSEVHSPAFVIYRYSRAKHRLICGMCAALLSVIAIGVCVWVRRRREREGKVKYHEIELECHVKAKEISGG